MIKLVVLFLPGKKLKKRVLLSSENDFKNINGIKSLDE